MKFSVVTPCLNPGPLLPETVESVLGQRALNEDAELQYVIRDGGSTDGTLDYLHTLDDPRISWTSEPDGGMYDALVKGLREVDGDVCSYLNAGDLYHPHAFNIVGDVLPQTDGWVTGMSVTYNDRGDVIRCRTPYRFHRQELQRGAYDGRRLWFVQQPSTFWSTSLLEQVDLEELSTFKLAGDGYLWHQLARQADLDIVSAHLGGHRIHEGQLSGDMDAYRRELGRFARPVRWWRWPVLFWVRVVEHGSQRVRDRFPAGRLVFDWRDGAYRRGASPR